jgi:ubiquinone/menaquinone biosynthesis C-methylase UbiE
MQRGLRAQDKASRQVITDRMDHPKEHYVPALGFHFLTPLYDPLVALTTRERAFKRLLMAQASVHGTHRVLDVGCGSGTLLIWLKQATPAASVTGIDADAKILVRARQKARQARTEIAFDQGLAFALPYADGTYDRVVSSLLFHHLQPEDKRATLREIHRVLVPGGELHVADFGRPNRLLRLMFYVVQLLDGFENTRDNVEGRLPILFEEAGFEQVRLRAQLPTILGTMTLYSAVKPAS